MVRYTFPSAASEWSVADNGDIVIETPRQRVRIELTPTDITIIADVLLTWLADNDVPMPCEARYELNGNTPRLQGIVRDDLVRIIKGAAFDGGDAA